MTGKQTTPPAESSCSRRRKLKDGCRRRMLEYSPAASVDAGHRSSSSHENKIRSKKKRAIIRRDGVTVARIPREGRLRLEVEDQAPRSGVACRSYGKISVIGRRRAMEDSVAVEAGFLKRGGKRYDFFGVYDGHGGCRVAEACSYNLHKLLAGVVEEGYSSSDEEVDWEKVMTATFRKMDAEVNKNGAAVAAMGSTAVVAVLGDDKVVVANCGDSRVVLSRGGAAIQLSDDHKPDRPDELKRIEVSGGRVVDCYGHRVMGVLATSRSIGDYYLKPYVATEPEVRVIERNHADECLILASDGLWDVISNYLACQVARRCFEGCEKRSRRRRGIQESCSDPAKSLENDHAAEAAALLAELAIARGSKDNISVVVVDLRGV